MLFLNQSPLFSILLLMATLIVGCGGSNAPVEGQDPAPSDDDIGGQPVECDGQPCKSLPSGVYESAGLNDPVGNAADSNALKGVLLRISWNVCGNDQLCLFDMIQEQLDKATTNNIKVALIIMDGDEAPDSVKENCTTFDFDKRGVPASMCLAWDANYLADKTAMVSALGLRFDSHPALAYVYFTGACSTNGAEGHCRVDQDAYSAAGYTPEKLTNAYLTIMDAYRDAFPITPIVFEVHAIFDSAQLWQNVWDNVAASGRVGVAAWWCAERLSVNGNDTVPVWSILQQAAQTSFTICQTVGNFTNQPYRFTDQSLGLDYGEETLWDQTDSENAFQQSMDWIQGNAVHADQQEFVHRFNVVEGWTTDLKNPAFQQRLLLF